MNYITPVKSFENISNKEMIELIKKSGKFGFGSKARHLNNLKKGDTICFYLNSPVKKVVLKAKVNSDPVQILKAADARIPKEKYEKEVTLREINDIEPSVNLGDKNIRIQLEAMKEKDDEYWGTFVQTTSPLTIHDFEILTNDLTSFEEKIRNKLVIHEEYSLEEIEDIFEHNYGAYPKGIVRKPSKKLIIIISGPHSGYDDEIYDDVIYYVGQGDKKKDQIMIGSNNSLKLANARNEPIYGFYQGSEGSKYHYLGVLKLLNFFEDENKNGYKIYKYVLERTRLSIPMDLILKSDYEDLLYLEPISDLEKVSTTKIKRDPLFSEIVKQAYDKRCAVCGKKRFNLVGNPEVEAAHILPKKLKGRDHVKNGISLCKFHHWAFDEGLFSINNDYKIIVKDEIKKNEDMEEILKFEGKKILLPKNYLYWPYLGFINAHNKHYGF